VETIKGRGQAAPLFLPCDLRDIAALRSAVTEIGTRLGPIRILVNNAANDERHALESVTPEFWDDRFAVNLRHQFFAAQAVAPGMAAAGGGAIVNFGSVSWMVGQGGMPAYTTAKAAVAGLTRALARDLGPMNIRVNCIVPGWIMTERQISKWLTPEGEQELMRRQCLRKLLPEDIARVVLFFAADDSACEPGHSGRRLGVAALPPRIWAFSAPGNRQAAKSPREAWWSRTRACRRETPQLRRGCRRDCATDAVASLRAVHGHVAVVSAVGGRSAVDAGAVGGEIRGGCAGRDGGVVDSYDGGAAIEAVGGAGEDPQGHLTAGQPHGLQVSLYLLQRAPLVAIAHQHADLRGADARVEELVATPRIRAEHRGQAAAAAQQGIGEAARRRREHARRRGCALAHRCAPGRSRAAAQTPARPRAHRTRWRRRSTASGWSPSR
jgi:NAD(P)-dependent dehydrogenase (short-subunit alcohol dehydrogenase family)